MAQGGDRRSFSGLRQDEEPPSLPSYEEDPDAAAIVKAVIGLAHTIGIKVVAEGIESQGQLKFLTEARCDLGQGYLFAKPMHAAEVPSFITRWLHPQDK